jgi:hypothetical protein
MSDEVLTVVGKCGGITEKDTGWFDIAVEVTGKQYPVKLSTKSTGILDKVRATRSGIATFYYKEVESTKINPNTNAPYKNRYLEDVEAGAVAGAGAAPASGKSGGGGGDTQMTNADWFAKECRDYRSRAWAQAISALQGHPSLATDEGGDIRSPAEIFKFVKPLQRAIYNDIIGDLEKAAAAPPPSDEPAQEAEAQTTLTGDAGHDPDDDIPF